MSWSAFADDAQINRVGKTKVRIVENRFDAPAVTLLADELAYRWRGVIIHHDDLK